MKKNIISAAILLAAAVLATSCAKELQPNNSTPVGNVTFTGVVEQFGDGTKTVLNSTSHMVEWESTDEIRINDGFFSVAPKSDATTATFTFDSGTEPTGPYTAYYPSTLYDGSKFTLPETQTYAAGKITNNPMYAYSETSSLSFHNLCGLVEFTLKGTATISKIIVNANAGGLSGDFTVNPSSYAAVLTDDAKTANKGVTLDCGTGVTLNNDAGVKFWIAIPEGTYTLTFSAYDANDTEGKIYQQITKAGVTVTANNIYAFEKTPTFTGGYLCFTAREAGATVTLNKYGNPTTNALEYSTNLSSWSTIDLPDGSNTYVEIATLANVNDKVYIRAKEARTAAQDDENHIYFTTSDKKVEVSGNIMYLVDPTGSSTTISREYEFYSLFYAPPHIYDNYYIKNADKLVLPATTLATSCYEKMFYYCEYLETAPALPATTLAASCYKEMFQYCESLETAPALPATTLAEYCYDSMFEDCDKLTTAPALPAMTLATSCYEEMFRNCQELTTAPALPATTLAASCYSTMFCNCSYLTTVPTILPAMTLAEYCYMSMFESCESLETAPALPATTLVEYCYSSMFQGCSSLTSITCLATDITAIDCTYYWVDGIPANGTFTKASGMTSWTTGINGIPSGWTVTDYIP